MRTQQRQKAAPEQNGQNEYDGNYDDPFAPAPTPGGMSAGRRETSGIMPTRSGRSTDIDAVPVSDAVPMAGTMPGNDAMQDSPLSATGQAPELDGLEELGPQLAWVSLDAPRGLLVCKNLDLEVSEFIGTIIESRVVRVMKDKDGGVFCASSNRQTADIGRPGRECGPCEDRKGCCFPRWWIAWREEESGQVFAHTLSMTGTMNFTRYAAKLKRDGLTPSQTQTRLFVEEARRQKAGTVYRRLQFEQDDPFKDH